MRFSLIIPLAPDRDAPILESIKKLDYPRSEFHVVVVKGLNPSENRIIYYINHEIILSDISDSRQITIEVIYKQRAFLLIKGRRIL